MEGIGSCNNLGFDSCQIQENSGCARIGSWGRVGGITGIYSVCIEVVHSFLSNRTQQVLEGNILLPPSTSLLESPKEVFSALSSF